MNLFRAHSLSVDNTSQAFKTGPCTRLDQGTGTQSGHPPGLPGQAMGLKLNELYVLSLQPPKKAIPKISSPEPNYTTPLQNFKPQDLLPEPCFEAPGDVRVPFEVMRAPSFLDVAGLASAWQ